MSTSSSVDGANRADARFAWLSVFFALWIVGGFFLVAYAYTSGVVRDSVVSIYHLPFYLGVVALAVTWLVLISRAVRAGRPWRSAVPVGYSLQLAGTAALIVWPILEIGWRQGVGIRNDTAEQLFTPSRVVIIVGCLLVAASPLAAAVRRSPSGMGRWPAVVSSSLALLVLGVIGFQPTQDAWLEAPRNEPLAASEIWAMNGDGTGQTRLIVAPAGYNVGLGVWSSDGSQIAYTRSPTPERLGQLNTDTAIWLASADGSNQRQLIGGTGWYWLPHWSPDGVWITFTIDAQHGPGSGSGVLPPAGGYGQPPGAGQPPAVTPNVDVWRIRADGSGLPELLSTDPAEDRAAVYSPDGTRLLFDSTRAEGRPGLYVADANGSNPTQLTGLGDDWGGSWSPDMTRVAFNSSPLGEAYDIYVTAFPRSGEPTRLTSDPADDRAPSWSPDGTRIAFGSNRAGNSDIWSMASDGSDPVNLTATAGAAEGLTSGGQEWGPDGRILYQRSQDEPASASTLVRQNLGVTTTLLGALILATLVVLICGIGAPFGAVTVILAVATAGTAVGSGDWRFVPAAIGGGVLVDIAIRLAAERRKAIVGAAGSALAFVLGAGVTVMAVSVLGWSPSLLIGVAVAAALLAVVPALLIAPRRAQTETDSVG